MTFTTRFAPSPTGPLHLGHAYSALLAHDMARARGGTFLLRIEDIDPDRSRVHWEAQLIDDLHWLGIRWDAPPVRQSARGAAYAKALDTLWDRSLLYPCTCTRRDIAEALSAPQEGAPLLTGPDGPVYPGTCRPHGETGRPVSQRPTGCHLRLHMHAAQRALDHRTGSAGQETQGLMFHETAAPHAGSIVTSRADIIDRIGDIVLARRDFGTSYHLSVVLDDAAQGITHVIRGADLFDATPIHVLLQRLLDLPTPIYHHHRLIRDADGKRLAKRDDARALSKFRSEGASPDDIRRLVNLPVSAP